MDKSEKLEILQIIDPSAYVAPNAVIEGNVTIGPESVISYGAVLIADGGTITVGRNTIIMENSVVRSSSYNDCIVGNNVMVGPHCHLSGCHIEDEVFIATGVSVFNGAYVKSLSELRINSIVHVGTYIDEGTTVPIGWIAVGNPAQCFPPDKHEEIWRLQKTLNFPKNVFGISRPNNSTDSLIKQMTDKYSSFILTKRS